MNKKIQSVTKLQHSLGHILNSIHTRMRRERIFILLYRQHTTSAKHEHTSSEHPVENHSKHFRKMLIPRSVTATHDMRTPQTNRQTKQTMNFHTFAYDGYNLYLEHRCEDELGGAAYMNLF